MNADALNPTAVLARASSAVSDEELLELAEQQRLQVAADIQTVIQAAEVLMARTGPQSRARVRALAARAHALCYSDEFEAALKDLELACTLSSGALEDELGVLFIGRIQPLARLGRLRDAADTAEQAGVLFRRQGSSAMAAKAAANLGIVLRMLGRPLEAIARFEEALAVLSSDPPSVAALQSNLAEAYLELDRFDDALVAYERAGMILEGTSHVHAAAIVDGNLAELYARTGRVDESLLRFEAARLAYERAGARGDIARLTAEEAEMLLMAGAARRSIRLFESAVPTLESLGLAREASRALMWLGVARTRVGSIRRGAEAIARAMTVATDAGAEALASEGRWPSLRQHLRPTTRRPRWRWVRGAPIAWPTGRFSGLAQRCSDARRSWNRATRRAPGPRLRTPGRSSSAWRWRRCARVWRRSAGGCGAPRGVTPMPLTSSGAPSGLPNRSEVRSEPRRSAWPCTRARATSSTAPSSRRSTRAARRPRPSSLTSSSACAQGPCSTRAPAA